MRIGAVLLGVVLFVGGAYGLILLLKGGAADPAGGSQSGTGGGGGTTAEPDHTDHAHSGHEHDGEHELPRLNYWPPVARSGPYPKAVVDPLEIDLGLIELGETREHTFQIRNEGTAELEFSQGDTTCECTVSRVRGNRIPPGGSSEVTLRWRPTTTADTTDKEAEIRTNDPENKSIRLHILGTVARRFAIVPGLDWKLTEVKESGENSIRGVIFSPLLDDLALERLEYDERLLEVRPVEIDLAVQTESKGRSGFGLEAILRPGGIVGKFSHRVRVHTQAAGRSAGVLEFTVSGIRTGPMRILGSQYLAEEGLVVLGNFDSQAGQTVVLTLVVRGEPEGGLQLTGVGGDPSAFEAKLKRLGSGTGETSRYQLEIGFAAGGPRVSRRDDNPGRIELRTNHPQAAEIHLLVHLTAY